MSRVQARMLPDGRRLHLNDGPIDLVIGADGDPTQIARAYRAAEARFETVLDELCAELPLLRAPAGPEPQGEVARRMWRATLPLAAETFITPMAAVAGSVAEDILAAMLAEAHLARAFVNNGGDIALHLAPGARYDIGLAAGPDGPALFATARVEATDPVRGIATSGWRGRSFSLGIADAVTVLAARASMADAAATLIANAVDLPGHPAIHRVPAEEIQPGNDLGARPVTRAVGPLAPNEIAAALEAGVAFAERLAATGRIAAAALHLAGETRMVGQGLERQHAGREGEEVPRLGGGDPS
ncbi:UPF0280 family protein [Aestuariivirga sp.]|uniref:UPF0280 family protein n=1 Tax=Aestuariivirga sp. TaxID=2650926 RepID=UPI00391CD5FC